MKDQGDVLVITGGSGFIGTHLITYLLAREVFSSYIVLDLVPPRVHDSAITFVACDIRQPLPPIEQLRGAHRIVCIHLAALCREPGYLWDEYFLTNYIGTRNVIACVEKYGIAEVIFTSTEMVYRSQDASMTEDSLTAPDTAYGISKLLAEEILLAWSAADHKRRLRIARPAVVFGSSEGANYTRLHRALRWNVFAYMGTRKTIKSSIYVKDLVRFLEFLIDDRGSHTVYNIAFPERTTIERICGDICRVNGWKRAIPTVPYSLALCAAATIHTGLRCVGVNTAVHPRRVQKLRQSTDILSSRAMEAGFVFAFSLRDALADWRRECSPELPH